MDTQLRALLRQYLASPDDDLAIQILVTSLRVQDPQTLGPMARQLVETLLRTVNLTPAITGPLPTAIYPQTAQQIQEMLDAISTKEVLPTSWLAEWRNDNRTCGTVSFLAFPNSPHPGHYRLNLWRVGEIALQAFNDASQSPLQMDRAIDELTDVFDSLVEGLGYDANYITIDLHIAAQLGGPSPTAALLWEKIVGPLHQGLRPRFIYAPVQILTDANGDSRLTVIGTPTYYYPTNPSVEIPVTTPNDTGTQDLF